MGTDSMHGRRRSLFSIFSQPLVLVFRPLHNRGIRWYEISWCANYWKFDNYQHFQGCFLSWYYFLGIDVRQKCSVRLEKRHMQAKVALRMLPSLGIFGYCGSLDSVLGL